LEPGKNFNGGMIMALINCKECSRKVSSETVTCPHCGAKLKKSEMEKGVMVIVWMAIAFMIIMQLLKWVRP
jgi:Zn finger protein HypA/HybF involved in hydrogenase expression